MNIFADYAPKYWEAGIPIMPLRPREKAAALKRWQDITLTTIDHGWLSQFPNGNLGLTMGHSTGFVGLDVDTEDKKLQQEIWDMAGESRYVRFGKKGYAALYRTLGVTPKRSVGGVFDLQGEGSYLVLPPSIHPDTGKPYTSNVDLWDVVNDLPTLPTNIGDMLVEAFGPKKRRGTPQPRQGGVAVGGRHNDMASYLGSLRARGIVDLNEIQALAQARNTTYPEPLPDDEVMSLVKSAAEDWEGGDSLPFTDYGNALRLVQRLEGKARFVAEWNCWVVWNGHKWTRDTDGFVMRKAKEVGRALTGEIK